MEQLGSGEYRYELIRDFFKLPEGQEFGLVSRVAADARDHIFVFQRKDPPVVAARSWLLTVGWRSRATPTLTTLVDDRSCSADGTRLTA